MSPLPIFLIQLLKCATKSEPSNAACMKNHRNRSITLIDLSQMKPQLFGLQVIPSFCHIGQRITQNKKFSQKDEISQNNLTLSNRLNQENTYKIGNLLLALGRNLSIHEEKDLCCLESISGEERPLQKLGYLFSFKNEVSFT